MISRARLIFLLLYYLSRCLMDMRDVNRQPACKGADSPSFTASALILHPSKTRQVLRRHCVRVAISGPVSRRMR